MKTILIISFTDLERDARVSRQINFLKEEYQVTALALKAFPDNSYEFIKAERPKLTFFRKSMASFFLLMGINRIAYNLLHNYKKYVPALKQRKFDLVIANDVESLPLAFEVAGTTSKVYFDAHEYAPLQFEDRLYWRIFFKRFNHALCRKYIPKVDGMSTLGEVIAETYKKHFGRKPVVITNAAPYRDWNALPAKNHPIRLVHHGIFNFSRQPEIMIDMMRLLDDRYTLDLIYLVAQPASQKNLDHYENFKREAEATGKIRVLPTMESAAIVPALNQHYDIGIILIPPVNFNYANCLPNKLFDCIQARIGLAVAPTAEIAQVVNQYEIGVVSADFSAEGMAKVIGQVSLEDVNRFKQNTQKAAVDMNAEHNKTLLLAELKKILD